MKTRTGKIARLPLTIREQLNSRLADGQFGSQLVPWLNEQPDVKEVLAQHFESRPITEQNLSEWKAGGHQDWLLQQEALALASRLSEHAGQLEAASKGRLTDKLAISLTAKYMVISRQLDADTLDQAAWKRLRELTQDVATLRRGDHLATRLEREYEKYKHSLENDITLALKACKAELRGRPDVQAKFDAAFRLLEKRMNKDYTPDEDDQPRSNGPAAPTCHVEVGRRREPGEGGPVASKRSEDGTQSDPIQPTPEPIDRVSSPGASANNPLIHQSSHPNPCPPASGTARPTCTATPIGPISPIRPIPPNPSESNPIKPSAHDPETPRVSEPPQSPIIPIIPIAADQPAAPNPAEGGTQSDLIKPTPSPVGRAPSSGNLPTNPSVQESTNPSASAPDPKQEFENCLWRMQNHFEPYDEPTLLSLYYAIPIDQR